MNKKTGNNCNEIRSKYVRIHILVKQTEDFMYSNGLQRLKGADFSSEITKTWYKRKQ